MGRNENCKFQSRNRESFIFYKYILGATLKGLSCFNLVIENLLFSTLAEDGAIDEDFFSFNLVIENLLFSTFVLLLLFVRDLSSFNLVIENLLFSTCGSPCSTKHCPGFNLVIENLLFSTQSAHRTPYANCHVSIS